MIAGAAMQDALKRYAIERKNARGEQIAIKSPRHSGVKKTSASNYVQQLKEEYGIDLHAMGIATEMPEWLMQAAADRLAESFSQDYWGGINDSTAAELEIVVRQGLEDGLSMREIADEIGDVNEERAGYRAMAVARTETGNAMSAGAEAGIRNVADDTGVEMELEWLSVCGTTTRPEHCELDGKSVPIGETFDVGGFPARWPSDEMLPPHQRINCQCTLLSSFASSEIERDDDASGEASATTITIKRSGGENFSPDDPDITLAHGTIRPAARCF